MTDPSLPQEAPTGARVTDGGGNGGLALQRPGFRLIDGPMNDAKEQAYREYETKLVNAWRHGAVGPGKGPPDHRRHIDKPSQAAAATNAAASCER